MHILNEKYFFHNMPTHNAPNVQQKIQHKNMRVRPKEKSVTNIKQILKRTQNKYKRTKYYNMNKKKICKKVFIIDID